jgi:hypothetical protein
MSHASECTATSASQSLRWRCQQRERSLVSLNDPGRRRVLRCVAAPPPQPAPPPHAQPGNAALALADARAGAARSDGRGGPGDATPEDAAAENPAGARTRVRPRPAPAQHGDQARARARARARTAMPSRAKFTPSAGSGSSGGTSSAGNSTRHVPSGRPYKHRFSCAPRGVSARLAAAAGATKAHLVRVALLEESTDVCVVCVRAKKFSAPLGAAPTPRRRACRQRRDERRTPAAVVFIHLLARLRRALRIHSYGEGSRECSLRRDGHKIPLSPQAHLTRERKVVVADELNGIWKNTDTCCILRERVAAHAQRTRRRSQKRGKSVDTRLGAHATACGAARGGALTTPPRRS